MDFGNCAKCGNPIDDPIRGRCGVPEGETWCTSCVERGLMTRELVDPRKPPGHGRVLCVEGTCPRCGQPMTPARFESHEVEGVMVCEGCAQQEAWLLIKNIPGYPRPWDNCWKGLTLAPR